MKLFLNGKTFSPRNIYGIGRNYVKHAKELGNAVPSEPIVFLKPVSSLAPSGTCLKISPLTSQVHHELELVVLLGAKGKNVSHQQALSLVAGYGVGLDMTARDLQKQAMENGNPWSVAKGFDGFGGVSSFIESSLIKNPQELNLELKVNGHVKQSGTTADMLFSVADIIVYLSKIFTLDEGDVIFTGTPEGVGPIAPGDHLEARLVDFDCALEMTVG